MSSPKYNRTFHVPWSPGGTSDDKIAKDISSLLNSEIVITEKVDGSNTSLEKEGCFARTHAGPPAHASFDGLKALHAQVKYQISKEVQIFGEWCFALHSIPYDKLPAYFLAFAVRAFPNKSLEGKGTWQSWEAVEGWANEIGVPTVPVLWKGICKKESELQEITEDLVKQPSNLGTVREGVVIRVAEYFSDEDFSKYVMKWVRKDHVQTSEHWKSQDIVRNKII